MGFLDTILSALGLGASTEADKPAPRAATDDEAETEPSAVASDGSWEGDWAPEAWRGGDYTWEQADELVYDDIEDDGPQPPQWLGKRTNPTKGYQELHVTDLAKIKDGDQRRMHAVYGVPVGWGSSDAEATEFRERIDKIEAQRDEVDDFDEYLSEWGFLDEEHYEWIREQRIPGYEQRGMMQDQLNQAMADQKAALNQRMEEMSEDLQPVEGISLQDWAACQAKIAQGADADSVVAELGVDKPKWDRVSEEWNARMSRDSTATIAAAYGQAFQAAGQGQFGQAAQQSAGAMTDASKTGVDGDAPISLEQFVEISEAQAAASSRGEDAATVLASFGMTPADWGMAGGWWSQKLPSVMMERMEEYNQLTEKYKNKYASQSADADIEF